MIVFDLACAAGGHRFEAWFASSASFADQRARGLIGCPICGDCDVDKAVMAPRLAAKGNQSSVNQSSVAGKTDSPSDVIPSAMAASGGDTAAMMRTMLAAIAARQAEDLPRSRWVGREFAAAARAMHEGRTDTALIHGEASPHEAAGLRDDGVAVVPLLVPFVPPEQAN